MRMPVRTLPARVLPVLAVPAQVLPSQVMLSQAGGGECQRCMVLETRQNAARGIP